MEPKELVGHIRQIGNLTQQQVAERTGLKQGAISKIERGEVRDVMSRHYRALQALLSELTKPKSRKAKP